MRWAWTNTSGSTVTTEFSTALVGRAAKRAAYCWDCLIEAFVGEGPLILGIDETLERRYGKKIAARGVYRDPVRSTHENFVKSSGLRWVCVMLLVEVPWASRAWALPFLSALAPSERYAAKRGRRHKKITEWAWQLLLLVRRWYPEREMVAVADRAYASLKLLERCRKLRNPITFITRLRLDAALYEPAAPRRPGQIGRSRLKGERLPNLSEVVEDPNTVWKPITIANWYGSGEQHGPDRFCDGRVVQHGLVRGACLCAGSWCAIRRASSKPRPSCVPTLGPIRRRSSVGL